VCIPSRTGAIISFRVTDHLLPKAARRAPVFETARRTFFFLSLTVGQSGKSLAVDISVTMT
jgi:hypothetical protein